MVRALAIALVVAWCSPARADDEADADTALRAAIARSRNDPAGALDELEAIGARRPLTRWSDNAWSEAARLAEARGDYARARHALEQIIAIDRDAALVERARAALARLAANTGSGAWDAVAREHERLVAVIFGGGDPAAALAELEALVRANPRYPRVTSAATAIARAHEMEGDAELGLTWMRAAADAAGAEPGLRTRLELARMALRAGELDLARDELRALASLPGTDRAALADATDDLARARQRTWLRRGAAGLLALLVLGALVRLVRDLGTWRAALRRLARPPIEVLFALPIAALVAALAVTGNPLVARAIVTIVIAGIAVAWLSGVLVDVAREHGRLSRARLALHVSGVLVSVASIVFLAVERGGVIQLLVETWRGGHALR